MENNYLSIAINDYEYLTSDTRPGFNNNKAAQCQQICEKLLKYVCVTLGCSSDLLRTHNLKRLYDVVKTGIKLTRESELYLSTLTDFYFDARYPGDDFINVSDEDTRYCFSTMQEVYDKVIEWDRTRPSNKGVESLVKAATMFK